MTLRRVCVCFVITMYSNHKSEEKTHTTGAPLLTTFLVTSSSTSLLFELPALTTTDSVSSFWTALGLESCSVVSRWGVVSTAIAVVVSDEGSFESAELTDVAVGLDCSQGSPFPLSFAATAGRSFISSLTALTATGDEATTIGEGASVATAFSPSGCCFSLDCVFCSLEK